MLSNDHKVGLCPKGKVPTERKPKVANRLDKPEQQGGPRRMIHLLCCCLILLGCDDWLLLLTLRTFSAQRPSCAGVVTSPKVTPQAYIYYHMPSRVGILPSLFLSHIRIMEATTVVGLATNIIQLIQVGHNILITVRDIRRSTTGFSKETDAFRSHADQVRRDFDHLTESVLTNDEKFRDYVSALRVQVDIYDEELAKLRLKKPSSYYQTLKLAYKVLWNRGRLEEIYQDIAKMGTEVTMHIVTIYMPRFDAKLDGLFDQNEKTGMDLSQQMRGLRHHVEKLQTTQKSECTLLLQAMNKWFDKQEEFKIQCRCISALYFNEIGSRKDNVKTAHEETFRWIMDEKEDGTGNEGSTHHRFRDWLHSFDSEKNIFWVKAKPGAGKSTLMKFMVQHKDLKKHLQKWVGPRRLIIAEYFFWKPGHYLQRSLEGLLRSLMYQILIQCQDLIAQVFPQQDWRLCKNNFRFTRSKLRRALESTIGLLQDKGVCMMIFVDGLDELHDHDQAYELASETELIELLRLFQDSPNVKLCVSSRILRTFEDEFGGDDSVCIPVHELTRKDIQAYVENMLGQSQKFRTLAANDEEYNSLIKELIDNAKGVFLWVHLVTCNLIEGIRLGDRIYHLRERLWNLPKELENLYRHILSSLEPRYETNVARSLLLLLEPGRTYLSKHLFLDDHERETMFGLKTYSTDEWENDLEWAKNRLVDQCKGLVDTRNVTETRFAEFDQEARAAHKFEGPTVELFHRSIADFLTTEDVRKKLFEQARLPYGMEDLKFQASLAVLHVLICYCNQKVPRSDTFSCDIRELLLSHFSPFTHPNERVIKKLAKGVESSNWDGICRLLSTDWIPSGARGTDVLFPSIIRTNADDLGLVFAIYVGSTELLCHELERHPRRTAPFRSLSAELTHVLEHGREWIVSELVIHGANPNEEDPDTKMTYWMIILSRVRKLKRPDNDCILLCLYLLHNGADLNATWTVKNTEEGCDPDEEIQIKAADVLRDMCRKRDMDPERFFLTDGVIHMPRD
jgi:hypothetical protein